MPVGSVVTPLPATSSTTATTASNHAAAAGSAAPEAGISRGSAAGRTSAVDSVGVAIAVGKGGMPVIGSPEADTAGPLIRESISGGVFLEGAVVRPVRAARDILAVLTEGSAR